MHSRLLGHLYSQHPVLQDCQQANQVFNPVAFHRGSLVKILLVSQAVDQVLNPHLIRQRDLQGFPHRNRVISRLASLVCIQQHSRRVVQRSNHWLFRVHSQPAPLLDSLRQYQLRNQHRLHRANLPLAQAPSLLPLQVSSL